MNELANAHHNFFSATVHMIQQGKLESMALVMLGFYKKQLLQILQITKIYHAVMTLRKISSSL